MSQLSTITGVLQGVTGASEAGMLVLRLQGFGPQVPRIAGTALAARIDGAIPIAASDGSFSVQVYGNDLITPPGTYYTLEVKDSNGSTIQVQAYRFVGPQTKFDLTSFPPFDPTGGLPSPIPANLLVTVPWSAAPQMDGTLGLAFELFLTGDTLAPALNNPVPGNLYSLILHQGTAQAWQWVPPANMRAASAISTLPGSTTVQTFLCRSDQTLVAIAPAQIVGAGQ